ncbi:peptidase [Williamsia sp. CHRR-6]|uniref:peptidase n=1 Tax=Williamsia sp. CHRR-6 TaxID=2835871 RepID=UPI001BDB6B53|nr:peptidase [Williamsia sp. CHRR-6]MBT0567643.1 peptidase [Williamsia sp. CHRR-6]
MDDPARTTTAIGLTPFHRDGELRGMLISGRWPETTLEWTQTLVASVRIACRPGFLRSTTVFGVVEDRPDNCAADTVGMMLSVGAVIDPDFIDRAARLSSPPALVMLHPPSHTRASLPECSEVASGCVLLPGVPELGLDHRAGWAEAEADGTVVTLRNQIGVDPNADPDTAVLAMLLAA